VLVETAAGIADEALASGANLYFPGRGRLFSGECDVDRDSEAKRGSGGGNDF
jgi:hypothetical protein